MRIKQLKQFINQLPSEADEFTVRMRNIESWSGDAWQGFEMLFEGIYLDEERKTLVFMDLSSTQSHSEKMKQVSMEVFDKDQAERDKKKNEAN